MRERKLLHEQVEAMDLFNMSKCQLLRKLSGYGGCEVGKGYSESGTRCSECRRIQRLSLLERIEDEYLPRPRMEDGTPVHEGVETEDGTVQFYTMTDDGDFLLHYQDENAVEYTQSQRVAGKKGAW